MRVGALPSAAGLLRGYPFVFSALVLRKNKLKCYHGLNDFATNVKDTNDLVISINAQEETRSTESISRHLVFALMSTCFPTRRRTMYADEGKVSPSSKNNMQ